MSTRQNVMQPGTKNRSGILWSQSGAADYIFSVIFFFIVSDGSFDAYKWRIVCTPCARPPRACERARRHKCAALWLFQGAKDCSELSIKVVSITLNRHLDERRRRMASAARARTCWSICANTWVCPQTRAFLFPRANKLTKTVKDSGANAIPPAMLTKRGWRPRDITRRL